MSVALQPLIANILIKLEPEPPASAILEVQQREKLCRFGEVVAIGPEVRDIKVGQRVLASVTAGVELDTGILIAEESVLGVFHE
jgi:co-chaperonin GroES (HSP10)